MHDVRHAPDVAQQAHRARGLVDELVDAHRGDRAAGAVAAQGEGAGADVRGGRREPQAPDAVGAGHRALDDEMRRHDLVEVGEDVVRVRVCRRGRGERGEDGHEERGEAARHPRLV
jgi:hypothetical protein